MTFIKLALAIGVVTLSASADAATRHGAGSASYDGRWSVEVITEQGPCDRAYRWSLGIRGGRITDIGDNVAEASGNIPPNGRVNVTLTRGSDALKATGALSGEGGQGTWRAPTRQCTGRWRAEKRG